MQPLLEIGRRFLQILGEDYGEGLPGVRVEPFAEVRENKQYTFFILLILWFLQDEVGETPGSQSIFIPPTPETLLLEPDDAPLQQPACSTYPPTQCTAAAVSSEAGVPRPTRPRRRREPPMSRETARRELVNSSQMRAQAAVLVDSEVLEQTWKTSRRERVKQQEQKIWEEFVEEKDVVSNIYKEDPYQFIEHLSEEKIKELLEIELEKMRKEKLEEEEQCQGISTKKETVELKDNQHVIFVDEAEREDDTFHIFDDEKEGDVSGVSGPEDELLNDSLSPPCTVRERLSPDLDTRNRSPDKVSSWLSLERQNILNIDPSALPKMMQRSVEFTSRFNRIHMYQLQRQVQDIKRNNSQALPFAKHTQFQSQMVRIVSLHQNVLHSLQVFIKSFPQTLCIRESGELLKSLLQMIKEILDTCEQVDTPANLNAAKDLFQDSLPHSTDKLLNAIEDYTSRMSEYLNSTENTSVSCSRHSKRSRGRKLSGTWSKSGSKSFGDTEAHLSMYSLDTLRNHSTAKMSSSKGHSGSRRPLMRDPQAGVPKPKRKTDKDLDVPTLVETVAPCTSSHMSREASPGPTPILKQIISKKGKDTSPRSPKKETKRLRKETKTPRKISKSPKGSKSTGKEAIALDKELGEDEQIQKQDAATPRRDTPKKGTPRTEAVTTRDRSSSPRKEPEVIIAKKQVTPRNDCPTPRKRTSRSEGIPWQEQKPIVGEQKPTPQTISSRKTTPRYMSLGEGENAYEKEIVDVSPGRESRRVRDRRSVNVMEFRRHEPLPKRDVFLAFLLLGPMRDANLC
ncbi:unnamed protein product [Leptosia nina]|uniref:Uncharacterized protein n=1 Tax=Leptosia nina TaxID=320188 RepID=A0AAV1JNE9_9NEOP